MKKLGFGIIGIILVAVLYYFTAGSTQIIEEMKQEVDKELSTLQENGFGVKQREIKETQEHFILSFDDPAKIANYLTSQGAGVNKEDILPFKGLQIGIDAKYLDDSYSALSLDIYPVALPESMVQELQKEDKAVTKRISKMISDKTLLLHLDFNKLLSGFKGSLKDIHETFEEEEKVTLISQGFKFEGEIESKKVKRVQQTLKLFSLNAGKELNMKLSNLISDYTIKGSSPYDSKSSYSVEDIEFQGDLGFSMFIKNLNINAQSNVTNDLLKSSISTKIDEIKLNEVKQKYTMNDILFNFTIDNLDITSFEALQGIDAEDEKAINALSQKILSKGISMSISNFAVKKIIENGKTMDGFSLNSFLSIDKSFNIDAISQNPLAALNAINSKTNISLSKALFTRLSKDPKAMMVMMLLPATDKGDKKIYEIELNKGKFTVNGNSL